ncbi:MAG: hypothetical protein CVT64_11915 [Actinobacteria bacterium HGW-Actinobacteria-4]|nr:MAG: hypothetical protein CVT64_11915 [Actinobacteria bacterium HGW-Actinobacteria-4]
MTTITETVAEALARAADMASQARALQAEAREIYDRATREIIANSCPEWCAGGECASQGDRSAHDWHWNGKSFDRFHRGILGGRVVEQIEILRPDGTQWLADLRKAPKGATL